MIMKKMTGIVLILFILGLIFIDSTLSKPKIHYESTVYAEGANVLLQCKTNYTASPTRWMIKRKANRILRIDCRDNKPNDNIFIQCDIAAGWYNLTIQNISLADKAKYYCIGGESDSIRIDVYVYQRGEPILIKVGDNVTIISDAETGTETLDLKPSKNRETGEVKLYCMTGCGYPAPSIKWYGLREDGSQEHFTEKNYTKLETTSKGCDGDLSKSESNLTLTAQYKLQHSAVQDITCEAGQDFTQYQGKLLIKTAVLKVEYGAIYTMSAASTAGIVIAVIIPVSVLIGFGVWRYRRHRRQKLYEKASAFFMDMGSSADHLLECKEIILKITVGEKVTTAIKNSLIPPSLADTNDNFSRSIKVLLEDGKVPPIIIGRGKYTEENEKEYILKVDTSNYMVSRKHLKFTVYDRRIWVENVGVYPVGIVDHEGLVRSKLPKGGTHAVRQGDGILLPDDEKTCLRMTYDLSDDQRPRLLLNVVHPEEEEESKV